MAPAKEVVVTDGAAATARERSLLPVCKLLSVTWTVKLLVPVPVGVPDITPVSEARDNPVGSVPAETDQA